MNFNLTKKQAVQKQVQVRDPNNDLTQPEIDLILRLLSQTTFPVKEIETLYIALYKLQNQYKQLESEQHQN